MKKDSVRKILQEGYPKIYKWKKHFKTNSIIFKRKNKKAFLKKILKKEITLIQGVN